MNIHAKDETIENILNILFQNTNIDYRINNTQIALSEKIVQRETPANTAQQQGRKTISGTVRDNENPIIRATLWKNPSHGTITDIDGNFILTNTPENATLQFTYVGMKPQEIPLSGRTTINIVMETDVELLDELVVVGYTTTSKRSLISSVSQVVTEELPHLPSTNITQSLAGRAPGLIVESGSGLNARSSVSIRGGGSDLRNRQCDQKWTDFANLNSEDIESISILKDASSTAVYRARAAYGIVQVTKSGKPENRM